ncbi:PspA/IM30 family protein [Gottfriedia sp. NPDC056225]|uniref:PspA/IM30 family protein n=1 Tax=Gottfriedia sp. NPDC056225 TaxID=3345751 RepID=UPI0035E0B88A
MGIFKRMKSISLAKMNGALDGLEDPISMLNQYIREMEEDLLKGQEALSRQIFLENKQKALILETEGLVNKRGGQAKLAVENGEESIAKLAIQEKLVHEKQLSLYKEQLNTIQNQTQSLYEKLDELKGKYDEYLHKRLLLVSRANIAKSIKQIQQTSVSFNSETIANGISRAEDRILMMEAEVQAQNKFAYNKSTLTNVQTDGALSEEIEAELQKLKQYTVETV